MDANALPIRVIVGLGNPGGQYHDTRHNAGFWFVDRLANRFGGVFRDEGRFQAESCQLDIQGIRCWLLKPGTFMNLSGRSVAGFARYFKLEPEQILVAHDELDLPPGTVRLKLGGGHAGHNGLRDIIQMLGVKDFWRLRFGIDRPVAGREVVDYVLGRPSREDTAAMMAAIEAAVDSVPDLLAGEFPRVMQRLHTSPDLSQ